MDGPVVRDPEPGFYLAHLIAALEDSRERRERAASRSAAGPAPVAEDRPIWPASGGDAVMMCHAVPWAGCLA
jgi:hypothetical protein